MTEQQSQLDVISRLLQLERSFRHAETTQELAYILVNDSRQLLNYRQAVLWRVDHSEPVSVSGLAVIDNNAPYIIWLKKLCQNVSVTFAENIAPITEDAVSFDEAEEWSQWFPQQAVWIPFSIFSNKAQVGLLLTREQAWNESELYLLEYLADSFAHAWQALAPAPPIWQSFSFGKKSRLIGITFVLCALAFPVRQTVLAPATVIAANPTILRAAIDGVVDRFFIQPNDSVSKDQHLLSLDETAIKNKLNISLKMLAVAEAEYRKTAQQAMYDQDSKSQVNILKSRIEQQQAEVRNIQDWLSRVAIKAPHKGIAIFSDVNEWIGRPVKVGERILMIADPKELELEIELAIADAISLQEGAEIKLYLNIAPINPISAELYYAAYQAQVTASDTLAYRLKARFKTQGELPRIGLKGTAKVYGEKVPLFYYLLRKPLAVLRQWLGM